MGWVKSKAIMESSLNKSGKAQSALVKLLVEKITTAAVGYLQSRSCQHAPVR
jgi:hypothetical protein